MQSPIESSDELKQLRTRLRKMSHEELVLFGKAARSLCRNRDCPDTFNWQLEEASAKWRGTPESTVLNCSCATAQGQTGRAEPRGPVHVRVQSKDKDCDEKRSATRSCNGVSLFDSFMGTFVAL